MATIKKAVCKPVIVYDAVEESFWPEIYENMDAAMKVIQQETDEYDEQDLIELDLAIYEVKLVRSVSASCTWKLEINEED
jgi:hypothetical protein